MCHKVRKRTFGLVCLAKIQIRHSHSLIRIFPRRIFGCAGWTESSFGAHVRGKFSHVVVRMVRVTWPFSNYIPHCVFALNWSLFLCTFVKPFKTAHHLYDYRYGQLKLLVFFMLHIVQSVTVRHYENTPFQIYWIFFSTKNYFQIKILIFFMFLLKA